MATVIMRVDVLTKNGRDTDFLYGVYVGRLRRWEMVVPLRAPYRQRVYAAQLQEAAAFRLRDEPVSKKD